MNRRVSWILSLWRKLRPKRPSAEPLRLQPANSAVPRTRKEIPGIEPLEGRIAPATLAGASTLSFIDVDAVRPW